MPLPSNDSPTLFVQIGLKQPAKPFPLHTDVGVLKWRLQGTDENLVPLLINCWPSEVGDGSCDVNIEYELVDTNLELADVTISIPLPWVSGLSESLDGFWAFVLRMGCNPVVGECDGAYAHESRRNQLVWSLPLVDLTNKTGALEFSAPKAIPNDFFPLNVSFTSKISYAHIKVSGDFLLRKTAIVLFSD